MLKKIFFAIALQGSAMLFAQEGVLKIELTDKISKEPLELANVLVESAGVTACKGITDSKGNLVFKNLAPGTYNVKSIYTGYPKNMITGVLIRNNETTYLEIKLSSENVMDDFVVTEYKKPLIDPITSIKTIFTIDDIKASPYTNVNDFMGSVGGAVQPKEGRTPNFRGARSESVVYILDGQRMIGTYGIPKGAIEQMSVTLGGVPAKYGDATGAFIEIETRSGLVNTGK
ncbi:MAG: carboxypeptidase-like regulatory domain-containing protein [Bacteroidetes bacterium]|nr:carboxypeptidase-like regulatory domain-containing protein [Bacteroidota bacterium]